MLAAPNDEYSCLDERYPEIAGPWLVFVDGEATELRSVYDEWIITEPTYKTVRLECKIGWVCHYCHIETAGAFPRGWELVWQTPICPDCWKRVPGDGGIHVVKGGAYAEGRVDPRGDRA